MARRKSIFTNEFYLGAGIGLVLASLIPSEYNPVEYIKTKFNL